MQAHGVELPGRSALDLFPLTGLTLSLAGRRRLPHHVLRVRLRAGGGHEGVALVVEAAVRVVAGGAAL